jgi:uncharacterized protein YceH (UPF0502 family)
VNWHDLIPLARQGGTATPEFLAWLADLVARVTETETTIAAQAATIADLEARITALETP